MKIRTGFVSNSSSSSFVIATNGKASTSELKKIVREAVIKSSMIDDTVSYIVDSLINSLMTREEFEKEDDWDEYNDFLKDALEKGMTRFGFGDVGDQDEPEERLFCFSDLNVNTKDLIIEKEGGY